MDKITIEEMRRLADRLQARIDLLMSRSRDHKRRICSLEAQVYQLVQDNDDLRSVLAAYMTEFKRTASYIPNEKN